MKMSGSDLRKLAWRSKAPRTNVTPAMTHFIPYATGMLAALQHVHEHGIVHNDVKPANFCLAAGDIQARSKVSRASDLQVDASCSILKQTAAAMDKSHDTCRFTL